MKKEIMAYLKCINWILTIFLLLLLPSSCRTLDIPINEIEDDKFTLNGVIVDSYGEPVLGATIMEKYTSNGVVSDFEGNFQISIDKGATFEINNIGFSTRSIDPKNYKRVLINIETGLIEFCCTNHEISDCGSTWDELRRLSRKKGCSFK